jgi:NAD-dependent dihydropyrimidine dehydrogenase PreA subunit
MITAVRKPFEEIWSRARARGKILVLGCGTCTTVCMAGGEREAGILASILRLKARAEGSPLAVEEAVIERQCDREFFDAVRSKIAASDAVLSMACGVGAQFLGEAFPDVEVLPALDTRFYGAATAQGIWEERCSGCGSCIIADFGGVCPLTRCSKGLLNGPCGGSMDGRCEVDPENVECGWQLIYDRMKARGSLDRLEDFVPPKDWSTGRSGGPGKIVKEDEQP